MPGAYSMVTIQASGSQTTQGVSAAFDCSGWTSLVAMCSVTSGTPTAASVTNFRVWLQGQLNPGGVWSDLMLVHAGKTFAGANLAAAAAAYTQNTPSLVAEAAGQSSVVNFIGGVNAPPPQVRAAWNIVTSGAPFITFGIEGVLSNVPLR